ncbi:tetratricopeptide repeat protein [Anaeromyxobacter terrae]|uniref:tetratricopeptide repeat protein n=1 Tax=Anaeromyxobacter terrae TaxID=2925406 RepID=UPI001F57B848|nr:tetratricopeptide repeat protein [Anaeromyxobacter sp. SG22]
MPAAARLALVAAVLATAGPARPASAGATPRDGRAEASEAGRGRRWASARAIASYLEAHRRLRAGDAQGAVDALQLAVAYDAASPELRVSLAGALLELERLDAAEVEARAAVELARGAGRTASEAHVVLARLAVARDRLEEATLALRQAIRVEAALAAGGGRVDPTPWRLLSDLYLDAGDAEAAARTLEDLAERAPGDASAGFRELGRTLLDREQAGPAERHLRRAAELEPGELESLRLLAAAHDALGRPAEARDDRLEILRREPDDAATLAALGRLAAQEGELERAREWFERYARATGDGIEPQLRIAFEWLDAGHPGEALAAARDGIRESGPDGRLRFAEGLALRELRRFGEAAAALEAVAPSAGASWVPARAALADALSHAGRHAEAERALAAPLRAFPGEVRLLLARAAVLARAGRRADEIALLRAAAAEKARGGEAARADVADLTAALAHALVGAGRPQEAVTVLRAALADSPREEALLYALGATYHRAGQPDAAVAQMQALLALHPDHAEALNFIGYAFAERGARLDEAERLLRRALELRPRSGHVLDSLGWVLFRRGEYARAAELLEQADALAGPDAVILEHLGDAYGALARTADAARAYRRALGTDPDDDDEGKADAVRRAGIERKLRELAATARSPSTP